MSDPKITEYAEKLRALGDAMAASAPSGRRTVFSLVDPSTGEIAGPREPHFTIFYNDSPKWVLALGIGNPLLMSVVSEIEDALSEKVKS